MTVDGLPDDWDEQLLRVYAVFDPTVFGLKKYLHRIPGEILNPEFEKKIKREKKTGRFAEKPGAYLPEKPEKRAPAARIPEPEADALDIPLDRFHLPQISPALSKHDKGLQLITPKNPATVVPPDQMNEYNQSRNAARADIRAGRTTLKKINAARKRQGLLQFTPESLMTAEEIAREPEARRVAQEALDSGQKTLRQINEEREQQGLPPYKTLADRPPRGSAFSRGIIEPAPAAIRYRTLEQLNEERRALGLEPVVEPHEPPVGTYVNNGADWRVLQEETQQGILEKIAALKASDPGVASSIEEMTQNILDAFDAASPQEQAHGEEWYAAAAAKAVALADKYGVDPHFVAALIAATSPRTEWESNLAAAEVALKSLLPEHSPEVNAEFLSTRMTNNLSLKGKKLRKKGDKLKKGDELADGTIVEEDTVVQEDEKPPTGLEYILGNGYVRDSFKRKYPQLLEPGKVKNDKGETVDGLKKIESDKMYEARISHLIIQQLMQTNPDGTRLKIYQYRDRALRSALMDINNRVLAATDEDFKKYHKEGMGIQTPVISADGYEQADRRRGFAKILQTNLAGIDRLFGYDQVSQMQPYLPQGWTNVPWRAGADAGRTQHEQDLAMAELFHRIDETLGGHKTRSFYNNIITGGKSDFATIDVHALRAALLGKGATRAGASVAGADDLLDDTGDKDPDQKRIGAYGAVNEAFRLATEQINARRAAEGKDLLSVAQVQAVAWIASRPESIGADLSHMAMQQRDPVRRDARVLPFVPAGQRAQAMRLISTSSSVQQAQSRLNGNGIDPSGLTGERFAAAKAASKSMVEEFKAMKQSDTANLSLGQLSTVAWLVSKFGDDAEVASRLRQMLATKDGEPKFTAADAALVRRMLNDRYTKAELLSGSAKEGIQAQLDAYNEQRRRNGVPDVGKDGNSTALTYDMFKEFLRTGDYV